MTVDQYCFVYLVVHVISFRCALTTPISTTSSTTIARTSILLVYRTLFSWIFIVNSLLAETAFSHHPQVSPLASAMSTTFILADHHSTEASVCNDVDV